MLDTGATNVVVPYLLARRLGLETIGKDSVETAKGKMKVRKRRIPEIRIRGIDLLAKNVEAYHSPWLDDSFLLGMSFICNFEIASIRGKKIRISS